MVEYKKVYPTYVLPTYGLVSQLRMDSDMILESKYNLIYMSKQEGSYKVIRHWCLANDKRSKIENFKAFKEVLKLIKNTDMPIIIANLEEKYQKYTKAFDDIYWTR